MRYYLTQFFVISVIVVLFPLLVVAQPDSGGIISEQKQEELRLPQPPFPDEQKSLSEPLTDRGVRIRVKNFEFSGYESIASREELDVLVQEAVGQELGFDALQRLTDKITRYLREEKGYLLAKAYLPEQDVTDGVIHIKVVIFRIEGKVDVIIDGPSRINQAFLERITRQALSGADTLHQHDIERAVLLINDLPGLFARSYLDHGKEPGTTRVTIRVREGPLFSGKVFGDNFGNRYTGRFRRGTQVFFNDPTGRGDLIKVGYTNARELNQGNIYYTLPLGASGAVFDMFYSGLRYELGGDLDDLRAKGHAHIMGANYSYPVQRTRASSLWLGTGYENYLFEDKSLGEVTSDRHVSVGNINMLGQFFDSFWKGGLTSVYAALYGGRTNISDGQSADAGGARTQGPFFRWVYSLTRLQRMTSNLSLFASARGQLADSNLDSSQKFILGGPAGVRAYPVGEASGDSGHIMTLETRYELPEIVPGIRAQLVLFGDLGHIRLNKDTWPGSVTNISGRNHYWLAGAGPGINIEKSGVFHVQFSYGHKIGHNPGRDSDGKDVNNKDDRGAFWIKGTILF
jgi:hemolysin activation/secretion protein